jgi:hypothetical protein
MIKASCYTKALQVTENVFKRLALKIFIKAINLPSNIIFKLFEIAYNRRLHQTFKIIKKYSLKVIKPRPILSDRIRGKILVSLDKN